MTVWSTNMFIMPRLSPTRSYTRRSAMVYNTLPPFSCPCCGIGCSPAGKNIVEGRQTPQRNCDPRRELCPVWWWTAKVPIDLETNSMGPWRKHYTLPAGNHNRCVLFYAPSAHRNSEYDPCYHCLAKNLFIRLHESRPPTFISAPF